MKNKVILIYFIIAILIVGILTTGIVVGLSDLSVLKGTGNSKIGEVFRLSYNTLISSNSAYCIQKDELLKAKEYQFVLKNYVKIDGKEAQVYNSSSSQPKVVVDNLNAQVAYILNKKQGYGTVDNPTQAQMALWHITNDWTTRLFGDAIYSWSANVNAGRNSLNEEAEKYAQVIGNQKSSGSITGTSENMSVVDKTNVNNIGVINEGDYYRVGPFRWEFGGTLKEMIVTGDVGTISSSSSSLRFVKYSGTSANIVDVSQILTGEAFYIDIATSTGISQMTGLTLKTTSATDDVTKIYTAEIWFFQGQSYQNIIYVDVGEGDVNPREGEGTSTYNINFEIKIGLVKVDDRDTSIPLVGVGFTFKATIQTYDEVSSTNHYKNVSCTHVKEAGYTDAQGVWHDPVYEHSSDTVLDWVQKHYEWKDHTMYLNSSNTWSKTEAHTYYTDNLGQIAIKNITYPTKTITNETSNGSSYTSTARLKEGTSVTATEVSNPYYGYTVGNTYTVELNNKTQLANKTITNHQELVKLSGYVWLDSNAGKVTVTNAQYDAGEAGFNGITVYLRNSGGGVVKTTTTSELGLYSEIDGGEYIFEDVDLDVLESGGYYVEFEYCGIRYQSVNADLTKTTGSKAIDTATRNILDAKFTSVDGNGSQSLNVNGVTVNYNETNNYASTYNSCSGCEVYARTNEAGYNLYSGFTPTTEEIRNVNLGLFEKAQTDFALTQDLYDVKIDVNGFSHIYRYAKTRYNDDGTMDMQSSWNVGVKFQNNRGTYDREMYMADVEYEAPNHRDNEIRVYVTYKVALRNESSYLGRINNLVDYCDNRYNLIAVGTTIDDRDNISGNMNFGEKTAYNDEYSKYIIDVDTVLNVAETKFLYMKFEMNREAILAILNNNELLNNVIEVNSYTTFKNNNTSTPVAVIDRDSVPGNITPGEVDSYEDDTDAARSLKLVLKDERALNGTVFVDSTGKDSNIVYREQERIGNGIFDNGETILPGIKVTLKEVGKDDPSYDGERVLMETVTDDNGNFEFKGYIPGNYVVIYTWGDETYKVQYYKGTIYDESRKQNDPFWHRGIEYNNDTISIENRKTDALDSKDLRTQIDDEMEDLKYNFLENEINKAYRDGSTYITHTKMDSTTPMMSFSVEYETTITDGTVDQVIFRTKNVDFGIVERPKQLLEFTKRISEYKITLANGQVLVEATVTEDGQIQGQIDDTIYMAPNQVDVDGLMKTEMDNELIEGATLETTYLMKVTNIGELDYVSERYYYYGNSTGADKVRVSVTELLDYVDGRLSMIDDKWNEQNTDYLELVNAKHKDNEEYINSTREYMTEHLSRELAPGESHQVDLHVSKLLTSTDDNTFENQAEITEITKTPAFNTGTPVKVTWSGDDFYFNVDNAETIVIIPNTGDDKGYVLPIIIGISSLIVLAVGVVLIKKFVIGNK